MTTREEIRGWLLHGKKLGASHVVVVCDTFDYEDYPVYVKEIQQDEEERLVDLLYYVHSVQAHVAANYSGQNMQKMMEVYNLNRPIERQLYLKCVCNY